MKLDNVEPDYPQFSAYQTALGKGCSFLGVCSLDGESLAPREGFMASQKKKQPFLEIICGTSGVIRM